MYMVTWLTKVHIILKNEILNIIFLEVVSGNYMKAKAFLKYFEKTYLGYMKTGMLAKRKH